MHGNTPRVDLRRNADVKKYDKVGRRFKWEDYPQITSITQNRSQKARRQIV
jgi:hypothetical protein